MENQEKNKSNHCCQRTTKKIKVISVMKENKRKNNSGHCCQRKTKRKITVVSAVKGKQKENKSGHWYHGNKNPKG